MTPEWYQTSSLFSQDLKSARISSPQDLLHAEEEEAESLPTISAPLDLFIEETSLSEEPSEDEAIPSGSNCTILDSDSEQECPICLLPQTIGLLTPCSHFFCKECLSQWLLSTDSCPMCRVSVNGTVRPEAGKTWLMLAMESYELPELEVLELSDSSTGGEFAAELGA